MPLFPPQAEFLLHWPVRETEQHRIIRLGHVMMPGPTRRHKNIVRSPVEYLLAHHGLTTPLNVDIDRAVR